MKGSSLWVIALLFFLLRSGSALCSDVCMDMMMVYLSLSFLELQIRGHEKDVGESALTFPRKSQYKADVCHGDVEHPDFLLYLLLHASVLPLTLNCKGLEKQGFLCLPVYPVWH